MKHEDKYIPDTASSVLNSYLQFCDVIITGKETAVALKYDEENMLAPMLVFIERGASVESVILAAGIIGVPVIKNIMLAKNLESHGKAGKIIPEASYRDVSLILARLDKDRPNRAMREFGKSRRSIPIKIPRPLSLELGASLFVLTGEGPGREKLLDEPLSKMRKTLVRLLGISLPPFRVSSSNMIKNDEYRILFKGLEAARGKIELGRLSGEESLQDAAKAASFTLLRHVEEIIQNRAPELLGRDEVEAILDAAEEKYPVVTGEVKNLLSLGIVREILQSLVSEQVSIRHIAVILETLADWGSFGSAPFDLIVERIRQSLKRQICLEYADDRLTLRVLTLEPVLERKFMDHTQDFSSGEDWVDYISRGVNGMEENGFPPVILCSPSARYAVKKASRRKHPNLAVLSYLEIPQDISVVPLGEIRIEENNRPAGLTKKNSNG